MDFPSCGNAGVKGRTLILSSVRFRYWQRVFGEPALLFAPSCASVTLAAGEHLVGLVGPQFAAPLGVWLEFVSKRAGGKGRKDPQGSWRGRGEGLCETAEATPGLYSPWRMQIPTPSHFSPHLHQGGPLGSRRNACTDGANHCTNHSTPSGSKSALKVFEL